MPGRLKAGRLSCRKRCHGKFSRSQACALPSWWRGRAYRPCAARTARRACAQSGPVL